MPGSIIIIDDERAARFGMRRALDKEDYDLCEAENGKAALEQIKSKQPDIAFLDLNMPEMDGMEALRRIKKLNDPPLVIVVTAHGSEKIAVEAMKKGAYDYLAKPYDVDELRLIARNALEKRALRKENKKLREEIKLKESFGELIGESDAMRRVYDLVGKVASTDVTVLITGESGTGKEIVAQEIHRRSDRVNKKFIPLNCASVPDNLVESELFGTEKGAFTGAKERKGKLEEADEGSLFLDEIGDMGIDMQAKVLRVLNDRIFERLGGNTSYEADVRFIAATNKDLSQEIEEANFREDLYYRIRVVDIHLPPLRERGGDIPLLINHFLKLFTKKYKKQIEAFAPETLQKMINYCWPGNVRELKNTIEKMVVLSSDEIITDEDLPPNVFRGLTRATSNDSLTPTEQKLIGLLNSFLSNEEISFKDAKKAFVHEFEKAFIQKRLQEHNGNVTQTAQALDMPRQSLQQKLRELGINPRELV